MTQAEQQQQPTVLFAYHWGEQALAIFQAGQGYALVRVRDVKKHAHGWKVDDAGLRDGLPRIDKSALATPVAVPPRGALQVALPRMR